MLLVEEPKTIMKIAFFEIEEWQKEYIQSQIKNVEISFFTEPLSLQNVSSAKDAQIISCFIDSKLDKEILSHFINLKMIATRSTGFDHIDQEECKNRGILVCNVPFYGENTVAEHTFALILALSRKIHQSVERTRRGDFSLDDLRGFDLKDKTLGIIGMGNIGQHVARIAQGFYMNVLGYDIKQDKKLAKKLDFQYASLEEVLQKSDIITLHAPYNPHTHHIINHSNMSLVKKGAHIINTARGGLIETGALVEALQSEALAGAGLDVLEEENVIK